MDLSALELFIDVMQQHSFAAVARSRNIDPSSVSRVIAKLERDLNIRLFQRSTRKLQPTEAGQLYFDRVFPAVTELTVARQQAMEVSQTPRGTLRVTAPGVFAEKQLTPLLPEFARRYPELRVELLLVDAYLDLIAERIDVAIRVGALRDSTYRFQKLRSIEFFICAGPGYLAEHGVPERPEEIVDHRCLLFPRRDHSLSWLFRDEAGAITEMPIQGQYLITNSAAIRNCAVANMGLTLLPDWLIEKDIAIGQLVRLFSRYTVTATDFNSGVWLLYPSQGFISRKTQIWIDYLGDNLRSNIHDIDRDMRVAQ
ncbi:LysR family transcriptional regulator [Leptothoe sp. PORK10 BA2]|uniref:LysR family transcriptional regulator n=1 Tax=Leptothoe sp. PORK10 BA2 TaxID=3110254 RepID=UPI002B20949D|nr:LysR family transcriptional regulator [Leptothoe sp. PORK10 BA2]MEA5464114.1 LysR family transcriptional regulator [Leptothoe sp. PORK10 BA2]